MRIMCLYGEAKCVLNGRECFVVGKLTFFTTLIIIYLVSCTVFFTFYYRPKNVN